MASRPKPQFFCPSDVLEIEDGSPEPHHWSPCVAIHRNNVMVPWATDSSLLKNHLA